MNKAQVDELREYYDNTDLGDVFATGHWEEDEVDPDPMIVTSLRLPKSLLDWVRARAEQERIKPTALIRHWIEDARAAARAGDDPITVESLAVRVDRLERAEYSVADLLSALQRSVEAARAGTPDDPSPPAERRGA